MTLHIDDVFNKLHSIGRELEAVKEEFSEAHRMADGAACSAEEASYETFENPEYAAVEAEDASEQASSAMYLIDRGIDALDSHTDELNDLVNKLETSEVETKRANQVEAALNTTIDVANDIIDDEEKINKFEKTVEDMKGDF